MKLFFRRLIDFVFRKGDAYFSNSSTDKSLKKVRKCLKISLRKKYGIRDKQVIENFLKMHGLGKNNFDFINNFEKLIEKGVANESVDTNANKSNVSITSLMIENALPLNKIVGYRYLYREMKKMYGSKKAQFLMGEMYDMSLALADSTNILKPYCFALNASKLVEEGRNWGSLPSIPPKRISSYIAGLNETVHQLSNHTAGALAVGSFFLDLAHLMIFKEGKTLSDIRNDKTYRKSVENSIQSFVHSMNSLSRAGVESPFTNISIFDRVKYRALLQDDNMGWYFDTDLYPLKDRVKKDIGDENFIEYIIDVIYELQEIYMTIMDNGDPIHNNRPITYPVSTINISRKQSDKNQDYVPECPEFIDSFCEKHDITRFNIYISDGMKVASCCRLVNDEELMSLGGQVNSFGGTSLSLGSHRVCTINLRRISLECSSWEDYKKRLTKRMEDCADILIAHKQLIKDLVSKGVQPFIENGWLDLDKMFSTFGIMGYYETAQDMKKRFGENFDYLEDLISYINKESFRISKERKNVFNVEQIPGETMSVKLANTDRWIYGAEKVKEPLYANQFIPLWEDATLVEKFKEEGRLGSKLTGGGICHYSIGENLASEQAKYVINLALKYGMEHFAINPCYSICENDHYTYGKHKVCPKCKGKITDYLTRTVGFFVKKSSMTTTKAECDFEERNYGKL